MLTEQGEVKLGEYSASVFSGVINPKLSFIYWNRMEKRNGFGIYIRPMFVATVKACKALKKVVGII